MNEAERTLFFAVRQQIPDKTRVVDVGARWGVADAWSPYGDEIQIRFCGRTALSCGGCPTMCTTQTPDPMPRGRRFSRRITSTPIPTHDPVLEANCFGRMPTTAGQNFHLNRTNSFLPKSSL